MDDMIHMSEGEKLLHYWPLWLGIIVVVIRGTIFMNREEGGS